MSDHLAHGWQTWKHGVAGAVCLDHFSHAVLCSEPVPSHCGGWVLPRVSLWCAWACTLVTSGYSVPCCSCSCHQTNTVLYCLKNLKCAFRKNQFTFSVKVCCWSLHHLGVNTEGPPESKRELRAGFSGV